MPNFIFYMCQSALKMWQMDQKIEIENIYNYLYIVILVISFWVWKQLQFHSCIWLIRTDCQEALGPRWDRAGVPGAATSPKPPKHPPILSFLSSLLHWHVQEPNQGAPESAEESGKSTIMTQMKSCMSRALTERMERGSPVAKRTVMGYYNPRWQLQFLILLPVSYHALHAGIAQS